MALASLGQICVRVGNLKRAEEALNRALDVRSPLQFMRETTGAVFDTLAQIHLIRGEHEEAEPLPVEGARSLRRVRIADRAAGISGPCSSSRRGWRCAGASRGPAVALASDVAKSADAPPGYVLQAELIAVEALLASNLVEEAQRRLDAIAGRGSAPQR